MKFPRLVRCNYYDVIQYRGFECAYLHLSTVLQWRRSIICGHWFAN